MNDRAIIKFRWNAGYLPCPYTTTEEVFEEPVILNWDGTFGFLDSSCEDIFEYFKPEDMVVGVHQQFTVLEVEDEWSKGLRLQGREFPEVTSVAVDTSMTTPKEEVWELMREWKKTHRQWSPLCRTNVAWWRDLRKPNVARWY
jgi:hypothetical protein